MNEYGQVVRGFECPDADDHSGRTDHSSGKHIWTAQDGALLGKMRMKDGRIRYLLKCPYCLNSSGALPDFAVEQLRAKGFKVVWVQDNQADGEVQYLWDYQYWVNPPSEIFAPEILRRRTELDATPPILPPVDLASWLKPK
jgi:hypothetical protein